MATCFEKCSTIQCFMTLKLYNVEYADRDDGENHEKLLIVLLSIISRHIG